MSQSIKSWLLPVPSMTFQNRMHFFCRTVPSKGHIISSKATVVLPEVISLWNINCWSQNASYWALKILPSRTQYSVKSSLQSIYWQWMIIILFAALISNYRFLCRQEASCLSHRALGLIAVASIPKSSYHLGSEVACQPCKGFGGKVTISRKSLWPKTLFVIPRNIKNREERGRRKKKGGLSSSSSFLQACRNGWPPPKDNLKDLKKICLN